MIRVSPFQSSDVDAVFAAANGARDYPGDLRVHTVRMAAQGSAFTLRSDDGRVLCIAGVVRVHDQSGTAWAIMARGVWGRMAQITRMVRDYLDGLSYRRIDMIVRGDFRAGHRWACALGFEQEAVLRCWAQDGGDMVMYVRIREEGHG